MADKIAQKKIRDGNITRIVQALLRHPGISRMEVAEQCGLSAGTVTQLMVPLLEAGIVEEFKIGDSTGGRRPINLRIRPDYGCVVTFEIRRNGMTARVHDLRGEKRDELVLATRMQTGNAMFSAIADMVAKIRDGEAGNSSNIVQAGLLCQDDIQDSELGVLFSTTADSGVIPLEMALRSRFGFTVRKELIERFSLDYYLQHEAEVRYDNYGYINAGDSVIASFTLNGERVEIDGGVTFNLTPFLSEGALIHNLESVGDEPDRPPRAIDMAARHRAKNVRTGPAVAGLARIIRNACVFFPVDVIFLGGAVGSDSAAITEVSGLVGDKPKVMGWEPGRRNIAQAFASKLLERSVVSLVGVIL